MDGYSDRTAEAIEAAAATVLHCSDVPPPVEGSVTVLHRLWKVGDFVQKNDGCWGIKKYEVLEIGWDWLYPGKQTPVLGPLGGYVDPLGNRHPNGYSRYVGCCPFDLRVLGEELTLDDQIKVAETEASNAAASFRDLGPWLKQRDNHARQRWQRLKAAAAVASSELTALRSRKANEEKEAYQAIEQLAAVFEQLDAPVAL